MNMNFVNIKIKHKPKENKSCETIIKIMRKMGGSYIQFFHSLQQLEERLI
ncbi:hypothetical protein JOD45_002159 [Scopulibacillus daqui]|uniref:Transposase n=1 Tax=Scopulibacillus daqui TaxID=1469162 RepID=A0ABS2Q2K2_9BACL|nr:hypothetical protein [Scopulibacillus daqui]